MEMEKFYFDSELQLQTYEEDKPTQIVGYAMKFNVLSHDRGGYRDVFRPNVFGESVHGFDGVDTKAYYDHDTRSYLGRVGNNSRRLSTDEVGSGNDDLSISRPSLFVLVESKHWIV